MQQDKPSKQPVRVEEAPPVEKSIKIQGVLETCRETIRDFDLENLLAKAKAISFLGLPETEREKFCAGMITLGETLTFCRHPSKDEKRWEIDQANIGRCASDYASVRNYFVHHVMYGCQKNMRNLA